VIASSGAGFSDFFSSSPIFAKTISTIFLTKLGIDRKLNPEEIHRLLVATPLDTIMATNKELIDVFGLTTFTPVVESPFPGVTTILDDDPEVLTDSGRGRQVPLMVGFTDAECESFRPRFEEFQIANKLQELPVLAVPVRMMYQSSPSTIPVLTKLIHNRYFNDTIDTDSFVNFCTEANYKYSALKLASKREGRGAPTFLYRFSYGGQHSALKHAWGLQFPGAGHVEDITYFFRVNSVLGPVADDELTKEDDDSKMKHLMTEYVVNFIKHR
jgi:carboxylesterase type B